jgi:Pyridoxamine 5'-phosphate oxidase
MPSLRSFEASSRASRLQGINKYRKAALSIVFETRTELAELQLLLDESFDRSEGIRYSGFNESHRFSAKQLGGFQGVRLVAVASVNSKGEPRAAPRPATLLHGKFYLATNSKSTMVKRLSLHPSLGFTYFENHILIMGHGTPTPFRKGTPEFKKIAPEWLKAFDGGKDALEGVDLFLRIDAKHLIAFATDPSRYPGGWRRRLSHGPKRGES